MKMKIFKKFFAKNKISNSALIEKSLLLSIFFPTNNNKSEKEKSDKIIAYPLLLLLFSFYQVQKLFCFVIC
ncbi:TPA: hypothetical protein ACKE0F_001423 [Enterococcus faecium]